MTDEELEAWVFRVLVAVAIIGIPAWAYFMEKQLYGQMGWM